MKRGALIACAALASCHDFDVALSGCVDAGRCSAPAGGGGEGTAGGAAGGVGGSGGTGGSGGSGGGVTSLVDAGRRYAFQTSEAFAGDLGGLSGADALCTAYAHDAGLPGAFVALLGLADAGFEQRLSPDAGGWWRVDGVPFASDAKQLRSGRTYAVLDVDERGRSIDAGAFGELAGSWSGPAFFDVTKGTCLGWTSASPAETGGYGQSIYVGAAFLDRTYASCDAHYRLFCVGSGPAAALPTPVVPPGGRRAFVSTRKLAGAVSGPLASAQCELEAGAAPGTWLALRDLSSQTGWQQLGFDGGQLWYRVDGAPIAKRSLDLGPGGPPLLAPVAFHFDGGLVGALDPIDGVWTGVSTGVPYQCSDWSSDAGYGSFGSATSSTFGFFAGNKQCGDVLSVYCFER